MVDNSESCSMTKKKKNKQRYLKSRTRNLWTYIGYRLKIRVLIFEYWNKRYLDIKKEDKTRTLLLNSKKKTNSIWTLSFSNTTEGLCAIRVKFTPQLTIKNSLQYNKQYVKFIYQIRPNKLCEPELTESYENLEFPP